MWWVLRCWWFILSQSYVTRSSRVVVMFLFFYSRLRSLLLPSEYLCRKIKMPRGSPTQIASSGILVEIYEKLEASIIYILFTFYGKILVKLFYCFQLSTRAFTLRTNVPSSSSLYVVVEYCDKLNNTKNLSNFHEISYGGERE